MTAQQMSKEAEQARLLARMIREHQEDPHPGQDSARLRLHAAIHAVVETQLRDGRPPETGHTLERLMGEGLSRHDAVHAIGAVVSEEVMGLLGDGRKYDEARFIQRLGELSG